MVAIVRIRLLQARVLVAFIAGLFVKIRVLRYFSVLLVALAL